MTDEEQKKFDSAVTDNEPLEEDSAVFLDSMGSIPGASDGSTTSGDEMESLLNMSKEEYLKQASENAVKESLQGKDGITEADIEQRSKALLEKLLSYYDMVTK